MERGDCIALEFKNNYYVLILHSLISENDVAEYIFVIGGESFKRVPSKSEIESIGILGFKYQNDTADLMNSTMRSRQKYDKSTFYTGVKYDVLFISKSVLDEKKQEIKKVASVNLNSEFYPLPNFSSKPTKYNELCEVIISRIRMKDPETINWDTIYDAYPLREVLEN